MAEESLLVRQAAGLAERPEATPGAQRPPDTDSLTDADGLCNLAAARLVATRRRGEVLEVAIFDAVLRELNSGGYGALTMEGVAAQAHTGKASLYRRWPSKQDLVADTLQYALPPMDDLPDHGDVRADILDVLRRMTQMVNSPCGCALQTVIGEFGQDHDLVRAVQAGVIEPRRQVMLDIIRRGVERGQVRPQAVTQLVADTGFALIAQQVRFHGTPVPDATVEAIVDQVVMPVLRA